MRDIQRLADMQIDSKTELQKEKTLEEKLEILSDAAKYDVACTSSGVDRAGKKGYLGNSCASGVTVVNIDNGFGAGFSASRINHMEKKV